MNMRIRVAAALVAVLLAACGEDNPAGPSSPLFTGTWIGPIVDSAVGTGTARLVLNQSGAGVTGTFTTTFANSSLDRSGTVSGTALTTKASLFLTPSVPLVCGLSGTMGSTLTVSVGKLTGSYTALACAGASVTGTLDLTLE